MKYCNRNLLLAVALCVAGCSSTPQAVTEENLVAVPAIIGSLKCAFAQALFKESQKGQIKRLKGRVAAGTLTLQIVDDQKFDAGLNAKATKGGPFVFPMKAGLGSILPSFSGKYDRTDTITTKIDFRYLLDANNTKACNLTPEATREKYGFSEWLGSVISGLDFNARVPPVGQVDQVEYSANFAVVTGGSAGLDFDVVFLSGSVKSETSRNDIQSICFTIAPASSSNPKPTADGSGGVGPAAPGVRRNGSGGSPQKTPGAKSGGSCG